LPEPACRGILALVGPGGSCTIVVGCETSMHAALSIRNLSEAGEFVLGEVRIAPLPGIPRPPEGLFPEPEASDEGPWHGALKGLPRPRPMGPGPEPEDQPFGQ
jgi:hypothetical protein